MKNEESSMVTPKVAHFPIPIAARGLFVLAVIYTLYFSSSLLIPICFAIFLNIALSPLVSRMARYKIPNVLSATVIVSLLVAVGASALLLLASPAEEWLSTAPKSIRDLKIEMLEAKGKLTDIQELAQEVEELTSVSSDTSTQQVIVQGPGVLENVLGDLPVFLAGAGITMFLTFFLLAAGDDFLRRLVGVCRTWGQRRRVVIIVRQIQYELSRYLTTVAVINSVLGTLVALTLHLLGVNNPIMWGVMVGVLNFAPYVGALMSACVLFIVGLGTFDTTVNALAVPGSFLVLTIIEGHLVSPAVLGKRMSLSPVTIFIAVMFWGWIWGVAGALMAVPMITCLKVIFDNVPRLRPASVLLFGGQLRPIKEELKTADGVMLHPAEAGKSISSASE